MSQWLDSYQSSWIYNRDITKNELDFGDLDLFLNFQGHSSKTQHENSRLGRGVGGRKGGDG